MGVAGRMALCLLLAGPAAGQEAPAPRVRLDAQGDPLPPRALFRLGAARLRFKDSVQALAFSPDGRFLAARGVGDAHIELCDAHTGKIDRLFLLPEPGDGRLAFSPDSQWLAWLGQLHDKRPGMLRVWQVHTGRLHLSGDLSLPLTALAFAPDSRRLAGVRRNLVLQTWELPGGKELKASAPTPGLSGASLTALAFTGPDSITAVGQLGRRLVGWDLFKGQELFALPLSGHQPGAAAFSADGRQLAIAHGGHVLVRDAVTGAEIQKLHGHPSAIHALAFAPDGKRLVSGGGDGALRVWDVQAGRPVLTLRNIGGPAPFGVFSHDAKTLATGGIHGPHRVRLWDVAKAQERREFMGHDSAVSALAFSPDGSALASAAYLRGDPHVRLWYPRTGRFLRAWHAHDGGVHAVTFSPNGATLATAGDFGSATVRLWKPHSGEPVGQLAGKSWHKPAIFFTPEGRRLIVGDSHAHPSAVRAFDLRTRELLWERAEKEKTASGPILLAPDGRTIIRAGAGGLELMSAASGRPVPGKGPRPDDVGRLTFSPDSRLLVTGDHNATRIWEMLSHTLIAGMPTTTLQACAPGGRFVALAQPRDKIIILDLASGKQVLRLDEHQAESAAFAPDGSLLATGLADGTILIWDVADVVKSPLPATGNLDKAALEECWSQLLTLDAGAAYAAIWRLAGGGRPALALLRDKLTAVGATEPRDWSRLIRALGDDAFGVREDARRRLAAAGRAAEEAVRAALDQDQPLEVQRRLERLLSEIDRTAPEPWRLSRAVAALEYMPGPEATAVLRQLAQGRPGGELIQLAEQALRRRHE
jgi:WD40 repeat protein